jgi:septal ring factor EnvC (AmiA/AmiB activator)
MEVLRLKSFLLVALYSYFIIILYNAFYTRKIVMELNIEMEENSNLRLVSEELDSEIAKLKSGLKEVQGFKEQLESDLEKIRNEKNRLSNDLQKSTENLQKKDDEIAKLNQKTIRQGERIKAIKNKIAEPTLPYEKHRRRVMKNIILFWDYFTNRTEEIVKISKNGSFEEFLRDFYEIARQYKM